MIARVRNRAQFSAFQSAPRVRCGPLTLRVAPSLEPGNPAVAYSIGRSVGNAAVRNRLRRQLRARMQFHEADLAPEMAYLISVHAAPTLSEIADTMSECLGKANSVRRST